jgi:hypothetical protein
VISANHAECQPGTLPARVTASEVWMPVREMAAFSAVRVWASAPGAVAQRSNTQGERAYRSINSESLVAESDRSSTADSLSSRAARR